MLIVPPPLIECLRCFDGRQTDLDLRAMLVRITGDIQVGELERHLTETLSSAGFLEDEVFTRMKAARQREFAEAPRREAVHAGSAYPLEIAALRQTMTRYMDGASGHSGGRPAAAEKLQGIAAPHVSPEGGWQSYRAAYQALGPELKDRTFVILATSHYGEPEHFGLTRKSFVTPMGETATNTALVDRLATDGGDAVLMEDYCHSFEHTVEFQVVFLQHIYGPDIRILPILCGQFANSLYAGEARRRMTRVCSAFWLRLAKWRRARVTICFGFWASIWPIWAPAITTVFRHMPARASWPRLPSGTGNASSASWNRTATVSGA